MRRSFASELNIVFRPATFSVSIRPLTVKTTSPFTVLVILSIFPLSKRLNPAPAWEIDTPSLEAILLPIVTCSI